MRNFDGEIIFVTAALFLSLPQAGHAAAGTTGGQILSLETGARAIGMGDAYTALADDSSSLYWNPAGLALLNQDEASFMYNENVQGLSFSNASAAFPFENGGWGGSLSYLSYGAINGYSESQIPTGNVNAYSGVATVGTGLLAGPLSFGVNLKGINESLADESANGFAADLGATWTDQQEVFDGGTFRLGATVRNMGTGIKFISQRDDFPLEWRVGGSLLNLLDNKLNASMDYGKALDVSGAFYTGVEYWVIPYVALRGGYVGTDQAGNGLRLGLGLKIKTLTFDFAYSNYGNLGLSQEYQLSYRFGEIRPTLSPEERSLMKRAKIAMEQGQYSEAVLLYDAVINLNPKYKPARRLVVVAMKDMEKQDQMASASTPVNLTGNGVTDAGLDQKELTDLLNAGEEKNAQNTTAPQTEQNTLAPYIPTSDDIAEPMK